MYINLLCRPSLNNPSSLHYSSPFHRLHPRVLNMAMPCHFSATHHFTTYALSEVHHPTGTRRTYPTERTRYLFIRSPGSTATNQQPGLTPPDRPCCGRPFPLSEPAHDTGSRNYQSPWCVGARRLHGRIHIAKDNASNEFHALGRFLSNLYDIAVSYPCTRQRALKSKVLYVRYLR